MNPSAPIEKPACIGRRTRIVLIVLGAFAVIVACLAGLSWFEKIKLAHQRASWKDQALVRIAALSATNDLVQRELAKLKAPTPGLDFGWTHEHVLLMTNGEFLIFEFRHGYNNGFVDHLFLAHGSDGRWLYSSYHFCNHMVGVIADDPPASISEFEKKYFAHEFDGKSDECLKHTWPLDN